MAILTSGDTAYFPNVTLTGDALTAAIARVQAILESEEAANRPLEVTAHEEILRINEGLRSARLSRWPVELSSPAPIFSTRVRAPVRRGYVISNYRSGYSVDGWGRQGNITDWQVLGSDAYQLDYNGLLTIKTDLYYSTELRAQYTAGWDFSISSTAVDQIKTIAGQVLEFMEGEGSQALKRRQVRADGGYEEEYQNTSAGVTSFAVNPISTALRAMWKYRPRGV